MGYRILIVDDSPVLRVMLAEMLGALGHEVVGEADCVKAGLEGYKDKKPDVVTLDVSLPDGNGLDLLKQLKRIYRDVKAFMVTGNDQDVVSKQAKALGALGVLHKPFDVAELESLLRKAGGPAGGAA